MFDQIIFCIGNKTIEVNEQTFALGELTTELLNIPYEEYKRLWDILIIAMHYQWSYIESQDDADWFGACYYLIELDKALSQHHIFRLIKDSEQMLYETMRFTEQCSLFPVPDCEMTDADDEILAQIEAYNDFLEHPDDYGGVVYDCLTNIKTGEQRITPEAQPPIPPIPPEKTRALLITPGNKSKKWEHFARFSNKYYDVVEDIKTFGFTFGNFINLFLSELDTLDINSVIKALHDFFSYERPEKLIASPAIGTGFFSEEETIKTRNIPRETAPGSGEYKIYEYYCVESFQSLIKMDFYRALEAGFIIRKCEMCGRYFLLKKAYHTKYCDMPNPERPEFTCAQLGYHTRGIKELSEDSPKARSLSRCIERIEKDCTRGIITTAEKEMLIIKAKFLFHKAKITPTFSNNDFEEQLASKNLYPLCGVIRKTKPRGRPKKKAEEAE